MKNLNFKFLLLCLGIFSVIYSCKPKDYYPSEEPEVPNDTISVGDTIPESPEVRDVRLRLEEAEANLIKAKESGDEAAQKAAQEARDDAQRAWDAVKKTANDAADAIEEGANRVGEASKEVYHKTKEGLNEAAKDVKEGADELADDVKNIGK